MTLEDDFKKCAVLGAGGKMGRGISLLVLQEMAIIELEKHQRTGTGLYSLILVESDEKICFSLRHYLRTHLIKYAEKNISALRKAYSNSNDLVSNNDIIQAFAQNAMDNLIFSSYIESASKATLVFEALPEDITLKSQALSILSQESTGTQYYFSNTSSIPIYRLNSTSKLKNRIVGLHFYNPPPIQKLIEISLPDGVDETAKSYATEIAKRLKKTIVYTKDTPGFISNGFFMREIAFAGAFYNNLKEVFNNAAALYALNFLTKEFLIRPMGIFELADFVGIDVCYNISDTMANLLQEAPLISPLIKEMHGKGVKGGINHEGNRNSGFFRYDTHGNITAVYHTGENNYVDINHPTIQNGIELLGPFPNEHVTWKELEKQFNREKIVNYFQQLSLGNSPGCQLSIEYIRACNKIGKALVESGIARSSEDVNTVLKLGFHQLYGPVEDWIENILQQKATL